MPTPIYFLMGHFSLYINFLTTMGNANEAKDANPQAQPDPPIENRSDEVNSHSPFEKHISGGEYIKSAVYGGLDGICTTLIIALSGIGSNTGASVVIALGMSSLIADGLSMAVADYLATKSDAEYMKEEEKREQIEIENDFEAEKDEMKELYLEMGLKKEISDEIVQILSTNKKGFLQVMMIQELQLIPDEESPFTNSIVTFFSFGIFGLMPLIPFFVAKAGDLSVGPSIIFTSIGAAVFFLIVLGIGKSCVTSQMWYWSALETVIIGAIASAASYGVGQAFASSG